MDRGSVVSQLRRRSLLLAPCAALSAGSVSVLAASPEPWLPVPIAVSESSRRPFVKQLLQMIGQAARIEWQIHNVPWARVLLMAERGQAVAFGVSRSASREQLFEFSAPIFNNHVWMVVRRDQPLNYRSQEDLQGRTLCITRGISYGSAFEAAQGKLFSVELVDGDLGSRARMLLAGRCDVMLTSHRSSQPWAVEKILRQASGHSAGIAVMPTPMQVDPVHFMAARAYGLTKVLPRLNAALLAESKAIQALVNSEI
jgi:ABC-type amino acid transport substrate-binding protein